MKTSAALLFFSIAAAIIPFVNAQEDSVYSVLSWEDSSAAAASDSLHSADSARHSAQRAARLKFRKTEPASSPDTPRTNIIAAAPDTQPVPAPTPPQNIIAVSQPRYVQVVNGPARVLKFLSPQSPILGMAKTGERLRIYSQGTAWSQVYYGDSIGWIECRNVKFWTENNVSRVMDRLPAVGLSVFVAVGAGILLLAIIIFIIIRLVVRGARVRIPEGKNCLIIAHDHKKIDAVLTDKQITMEECFREIGFEVTSAEDLHIARSILMHYLPDILCVDWDFSENIERDIEGLLTDRTSMANVFVLFYNVPDPQKVEKQHSLPNTHYIGLALSDRDIFKAVTPLIIAGHHSKSVRTSIENHALEGGISQGSLSEVMQFIELGKKNGCLLIDSSGPYGMMYFNQARIVYAATKEKTATDAIYDMLSLQKGNFRFILDKMPAATNINISALEILMEWAKKEDEASRN